MSQALVEQVKAQLVAQGMNLSGPCGAFAITKRVAWALRATGAGLLAKPTGNNCDGYATDIICYPDGRIRDILGDGGGANTPQWPDGELEIVDPSRYLAAIDPGDTPIPTPEPVPTPLPTPTPLPPVVDLSPVLAKLEQMRTEAQERDDDLLQAFKLTLEKLAEVYNRQDRALSGALGLKLRLTPENK